VDSFQTKLENFLGNERRKINKAAMKQMKSAAEEGRGQVERRGKGGGNHEKERVKTKIASVQMRIGDQVDSIDYPFACIQPPCILTVPNLLYTQVQVQDREGSVLGWGIMRDPEPDMNPMGETGFLNGADSLP
jgi:hypothetical protein